MFSASAPNDLLPPAPAAAAEPNEFEWPGPKAWPVGMCLISFFALNAFIQALRAEL